MVNGNTRKKTLKKGEQEVGNEISGKIISRDRRTAVCQSRREIQRMLAINGNQPPLWRRRLIG